MLNQCLINRIVAWSLKRFFWYHFFFVSFFGIILVAKEERILLLKAKTECYLCASFYDISYLDIVNIIKIRRSKGHIGKKKSWFKYQFYAKINTVLLLYITLHCTCTKFFFLLLPSSVFVAFFHHVHKDFLRNTPYKNIVIFYNHLKNIQGVSWIGFAWTWRKNEDDLAER